MIKKIEKNSCLCSGMSIGQFCSEDSVQYIAPSNGNWGLVRVLLLVPEAHVLFVIPEACGRHTAFGALHHGLKQRVSYYFVSKEEITAGYDSEIKEAAKQLLERLPYRPKVVFIVVGCIDDLIGTDIARIVYELNQELPEVRFSEAHMNPITGDTKEPPLVTAQHAMYALLIREGTAEAPSSATNRIEASQYALNKINQRTINCIGNFQPIAKTCEFYGFVKALGIKEVRHISDYKNFAEFQEMANSSYNFLMHNSATLGVELLREKLGIEYEKLIVSYRPETIAAQYRMIYQALCPDATLDFPDLSASRETAQATIQRTLETLGNREIWVCEDSVLRPFELARFLFESGFNISCVVASMVPKFEYEAKTWLEEHVPNLKYIQSQHHRVPMFEHRNPEIVGIGFHAAYLAGSPYVVPIMNDEFNFGYDGVCRLMRALCDAVSEKRDLQALITKYGLVV